MSKPGQHLFDDMRKYCSFLVDDVVDWKQSGLSELTAILNDGTRVKYNASDHRYTILGNRSSSNEDDERYFITEEECRHEFARRLRSCMRDRGMTQTMLSDLTDISQVTMSKYINGRALPGYYNIGRLARALRCSVNDLMVSE